jgi:hypothetical protein
MDAADLRRIHKAIKDGINSRTINFGLAQSVLHELEMNGYKVVKMSFDEIIADRTLSQNT